MGKILAAIVSGAGLFAKVVGATFLLLAAFVAAIIGHAFYKHAEAAEMARSFCAAVAIGTDERSAIAFSIGFDGRHSEAPNKHIFSYQGGFGAVSCVITVRDGRVTEKSLAD